VFLAIASFISKERKERESGVREEGGPIARGAKIRASLMGGMWQGGAGLALQRQPLFWGHLKKTANLACGLGLNLAPALTRRGLVGCDPLFLFLFLIFIFIFF
jgi:hypothetical protein